MERYMLIKQFSTQMSNITIMKLCTYLDGNFMKNNLVT